MAHGAFKYRLLKTPWGTMAIVTGRRGLAGVVLPLFGETAAAQEVLRRWPGAVCANGLLPRLVRDIRDYFAGRSAKFAVQADLSRLTEFQRRVLTACRKIPPGRATNYGKLARKVGRPRAARAVGRVMATNPMPLIIPCHRVVAANGRLGGFSARGGPKLKARLLAHERLHFARRRAGR